MPSHQDPQAQPARLSLRLGRWMELHAVGWGVAAAPLLVILLACAAVAVLALPG